MNPLKPAFLPSSGCLKGQEAPGGGALESLFRWRLGGCLHAQTSSYADLATLSIMSPGPAAGNLVGKDLFALSPVFAHSWSFINTGSPGLK